MKINSLLQEGITAASDPANTSSPAPTFGRSDKFLGEKNETVEESTTSGSVASVAAPIGGMQRRGQGSMLKGIKTSAKFPNSASVKEGRYNNRDAYQRDYDSSQTGFSRGRREDDEYHVPDPDPSFERNRQETMMYNVTVNGQPVNPKPMLGRSAALAWAKQQVAAGQLDAQIAKLSPVQYTEEGQQWPDSSNSLAKRKPVVAFNNQGVKAGRPGGMTVSTRVEPTITPTSVKRLGGDRPVPSFLQKEGEEMSTFAALKDWRVWNVHVFNNFYRGKYADYGPRLYSVVASSPEEARQVVIDNPDYVLQDLLSRKLQNGKKVLPRGSALPIEEKRVGKAEPGTITTMALKKMLTPDGVQSFKFTNGKIVDGAHVAGGEEINEKSKSQAQFRTMAAVANNPEFAKKVGIKQSVGKEFHKADKKQDYKDLPKEVEEGYSDMMAKERKKRLAAVEKKKQERRANTGDPAPQHYRDELAQAAKKYKKGVAEGFDNQLPQDTLDLIDEYIAKVEPGADRNEMIKHVVDGSIHTSELEYALQEGVYENEEYDDEAGMAESNLHTIARAAQGLIDTIGENENLPEWAQEKIAKVEGMLVAVWDYLESQEEQGIDPQVDEDWQKTNKQDKTDGMSPKAVKAYRRENPGSKLKTAVTTKPSKLKPGSKAAKRRKSFCARMSGNKGPMKDEKGRPTPKAKALRRWNCESVEQTVQMLESVQLDLVEMKQRLDPKCWKGYKKSGTKMKGDTRVNNCVKVDEAEVSEDKLANDLYKDFQIFKKGADKDIGSKAKDKDISSKAKDKDIVAKMNEMDGNGVGRDGSTDAEKKQFTSKPITSQQAQDKALDTLKKVLSKPENMNVLKRLKNK